MTTLTICIMLAGATLAGAVLGALAALAWQHRHAPATIARLTAMSRSLAEEVEAQRARAWRAEHKLAFWIGLRDTTIITVDLRRPDR